MGDVGETAWRRSRALARSRIAGIAKSVLSSVIAAPDVLTPFGYTTFA